MSNPNEHIRAHFTCRVSDTDFLKVEPTTGDQVWLRIFEQREDGDNRSTYFVLSAWDSTLLARLMRGEVDRTFVNFTCAHESDDRLEVSKSSTGDGWCFVGFRDGKSDTRADVIIRTEDCLKLADHIRPNEEITTVSDNELIIACKVSPDDNISLIRESGEVFLKTQDGMTVFITDEQILDVLSVLGKAFNDRNKLDDVTITANVTVEKTVVVEESKLLA